MSALTDGFGGRPPEVFTWPTEEPLLQNDPRLIRGDPWRLLTVCALCNVTPGPRARVVAEQLFARWPTAEAMTAATYEEVKAVVASLGLGSLRTGRLRSMASAWVDVDWARVAVGEDDHPLLDVPGVGPYAHDAWWMFVRRRLWPILKARWPSGYDHAPADKELARFRRAVVDEYGLRVVVYADGPPHDRNPIPSRAPITLAWWQGDRSSALDPWVIADLHTGQPPGLSVWEGAAWMGLPEGDLGEPRGAAGLRAVTASRYVPRTEGRWRQPTVEESEAIAEGRIVKLWAAQHARSGGG